MRFAYADPPYLGQCALYKHAHPDGERPFDGRCWDERDTHLLLVNYLLDEYGDGFALSLSSPTIQHYARILPDDIRWGAWVKPFASYKPGINPGYCWEPLAFHGGRRLGRDVDTVRDYVAANIVLETGTVGAKPLAFCSWVIDLLGYDSRLDTLDDLFPGSGRFERALRGRDQPELAL